MVNFDKEFEKGPKTYDQHVGKWWNEQAKDKAHKEAYENIAKFAKRYVKHPKLIVDFACGGGEILTKVQKQFPKSQLLGIDGSEKFLESAKKKVNSQKAHFVQSFLPNFSLPKGEADLIFFTFPNIVPDPDEQPYYDEHGYEDPSDDKVADYLAHAREEDPDDETVGDESEDLKDTLLSNKVISRNIRSLLKKGGYFIRVEYANAPRDELTELVEARTAFEEGSLEVIKNKKPVQLFKKIKTQYFKSDVILDVYHQTQDETDKEGGYFITLLQAI